MFSNVPRAGLKALVGVKRTEEREWATGSTFLGLCSRHGANVYLFPVPGSEYPASLQDTRLILRSLSEKKVQETMSEFLKKFKSDGQLEEGFRLRMLKSQTLESLNT